MGNSLTYFKPDSCLSELRVIFSLVSSQLLLVFVVLSDHCLLCHLFSSTSCSSSTFGSVPPSCSSSSFNLPGATLPRCVVKVLQSAASATISQDEVAGLNRTCLNKAQLDILKDEESNDKVGLASGNTWQSDRASFPPFSFRRLTKRYT